MRNRKPNRTLTALTTIVLLFGASAIAVYTASAAASAQRGGIGYVELQPATLRAFTQYEALTEARIANELSAARAVGGGGAFLFPDTLGPAAREAANSSLREGKTRIEELHTLDGGVQIPCPGGLIHHWLGIIFIPGATLERTLQLVRDYNRQAEIYAPEVVQSRVISHSGNDYKIFLRFKQQDVITVVLDTEHDVHYTPMDAQRATSKSISTSIREVVVAGKPGEHDLAADTGGGYLWRINTYWRFLARDGGVYVQCESISLTRDIPTGLGWIVGPFVTSIPRDSLSFTLEAMRKALLAAK